MKAAAYLLRWLTWSTGFLALVAIWQIVVVIVEPPPVVLPTPLASLQSFVSLIQSPRTWGDIGISLFRVGAGFALAIATGVPIGMLLARSRRFRDLVQPTLEGLRFVIPFAWIPIVSFWFALSEAGKIFITWYAAFFIVVFQTEMGFLRVDERLIKAARTLGAQRRNLLWKVDLPAAAPTIVTGLRLGLAFAWISILAAELVNAKSGIGYFTLNAAELFRTDRAFAAMIIIGILGFSMDHAFRIAERRLFGWYRANDMD